MAGVAGVEAPSGPAEATVVAGGIREGAPPGDLSRLPSLAGVLRADAQRSPDPASTPTVLPPSEASPTPAPAATE
eukprot:10857645-Alexandrium_andersonii.AAC.1